MFTGKNINQNNLGVEMYDNKYSIEKVIHIQ